MASGNKGRFSERLKRIAFMKRRNSNRDVSNENNSSISSNESNSSNNSHAVKRFLLIPIMFMEGLFVKNDQKTDGRRIKTVKEEENYDLKKDVSVTGIYNEKKRVNGIRVKKGLPIKSVTQIPINQVNNKETGGKNSELSVTEVARKDNVVEKDIESLEKEIIKLIKKRLIKLYNEYEILGSDFYVLKELLKDDFYYDKCIQNVKEIKKLLSKINSLKAKYDYLKDNVDFDNLLEMNDDLLEDKILELRDQLNSDHLDYLVKDYKLLKEYQGLYLKIDKLQEDAEIYEEERIKRCEALKKNNIDFEKFKLKLYNYSAVNDSYLSFVEKQNMFLKELNEKIRVIDSYEKVQYSFKGIGALISNSFKYAGLLMLSPLRGIIPGIATQTIISKNIIDNLKETLSLEEKRTIVYKAIDYSDEINRAVNNLDYVSTMIDSSLSDIESLKRVYNEKFKKYQDKYSDYKVVIKQLNKIENSIKGNKVKLDLIKRKMTVNKQINEDKLVKVRKLNLPEDRH